MLCGCHILNWSLKHRCKQNTEYDNADGHQKQRESGFGYLPTTTNPVALEQKWKHKTNEFHILMQFLIQCTSEHKHSDTQKEGGKWSVVEMFYNHSVMVAHYQKYCRAQVRDSTCQSRLALATNTTTHPPRDTVCHTAYVLHTQVSH